MRSAAARGAFLSSANNDPFGFTSNGRIDDDAWYYGVWFDPGTLAARIERELTRLTATGGVTVAQMQQLQLDMYNTLADDIVPVLTEAVGRVATDPALAMYRGDEALAGLHARLAAWDRRMDRRASEPVVYEAFQHFFARQVLADDLDLRATPSTPRCATAPPSCPEALGIPERARCAGPLQPSAASERSRRATPQRPARCPRAIASGTSGSRLQRRPVTTQKIITVSPPESIPWRALVRSPRRPTT